MRKAAPLISLIIVLSMIFGIFTAVFAEEPEGGDVQSQAGAVTVEGSGEEAGAEDEGKTPEGEEPKEGEDKEDGEKAGEEAEGEDGTDTDGEKGGEEAKEPAAVDGKDAAEPEAVSSDKAVTDAEKKGYSTKSIFSRGVPTLKTDTFYKIFDLFRLIKYVLTGHILYSAPKDVPVTVDENIQMICQSIYDQSGLDIYKILTNMPDIQDPGRIAVTVFHIDTKEYRDEMYEMRDKYYAEGDRGKGRLCWMMGVYMSSIEKADLWLDPVKGKDYSQIVLDVTYVDGETEQFRPIIYINPETGECFGYNDKGMMNVGFNTNAYEGLVYAPINCWMRSFGFCLEYDLLCYALPMYRYNTRRFHFDYAGKEWMIQAWKGNYLITNGGEVGIYNREKGSLGTFYNVVSEDEQMDMSLQILHDGEVLVNIPEQNHWWVNGFNMSERLYNPHGLVLIATIVMKDEEMLEAFTQSIERNMWHDVSYSVDGLKVTIVWDS